jgi:hypothetical protein
MSTLPLDIFRKDVRGNPVWLDCVSDVQTARSRLSQLASLIPGEYFAFDQRTRQIILSLVRLASDEL